MNKKLERLLQKVSKAREELRAAVSHEQQVCKHEEVEECDYMPLNFDGSLPPLRVCCNCGMSEEGWGCGFVVLKGKAQQISRDTLYAKRYGFSIKDEHKGALLRREITVAQLVSDGLA